MPLSPGNGWSTCSSRRQGDTAAVPGGFGTGKTMLLQQIVKWCDADVIVFVGCGERGNELADAMADLPSCAIPRPVAAARAHRRHRQYLEHAGDGARGEHLHRHDRRGVLSRHGYDACCSPTPHRGGRRRCASFHRAAASCRPRKDFRPGWLGHRRVLRTGRRVRRSAAPGFGHGDRRSVSARRRYDRAGHRANRALRALPLVAGSRPSLCRHYPAVTWRSSFSRDVDIVGAWHASAGRPEWARDRARAVAPGRSRPPRFDRRACRVGGLPAANAWFLLAGRLLREAVLQQNALSPNDAICGPAKQLALLELVLAVYDASRFSSSRSSRGGDRGARSLTVVRVRDEVGPDDATGVARIREQTSRP